MDICTFIVITTLNTVGCGVPEQCKVHENVHPPIKVCIPFHAISCPTPKPQYDCQREDGSHYIVDADELTQRLRGAD